MPGGVELLLESSGGTTLDTAIEQADLIFPPEDWTAESENRWTRGAWACVRVETGWMVEHPRGRMKQRFASCDRARKWVDLRVDRPGGIRGPRLRTDAPALCTFPDVRVTQEERGKAMKLAKSLGLTFADFLRSAVQLVDDLNAAGTFDTDATARGKKLIPLSPARNVRATYAE